MLKSDFYLYFCVIIKTKTKMKLTNNKTGHSFNLSNEDVKAFFEVENSRGQKINKQTDYTIKDTSKEISGIQFFVCCVSLFALSIGSFLLYIHLNY